MMERVEGAVAINIREPLLSSRNLEAVSDEITSSGSATSTIRKASDNFIFRVPSPIRERNKHLYEPQMVAIGPYGRRNEPSLRAMESLKLSYREEFCSRSGKRSIEYYKAKIQELEPQARRCYFEQVELSTDEFAEMLLLDGCFIIEFIIKWNKDDEDGLFAADWSLPLIRDDLLLLENQIPLFVLEKLSEGVTFTIDGNRPSLMELLVNYLTAMNVESPEEEIESSNKEVEGNNNDHIARREVKEYNHLLHLYYCCYVTKPQTDPTGCTNCGTILKWLNPTRIFTLLLSYIRSKICTSHSKRSSRTIPSATKLLEAGVTIKKKKKKEKKKNRLSSFLDVAFKDGVLEIPFISVEPSTLPRFSNLVAFEQSGGCKPEEAYMTSYAVFMNCLIDTPKDVAILHQRGILENNLASDKELAVFFNQLSDRATLDSKNHYLVGLFREVGEYCDSSWHKWRAILVRDYFSNPWAIISLIAAAVLLILTIVQTVYTIYSYYHPKNPSLSSWELTVSGLRDLA